MFLTQSQKSSLGGALQFFQADCDVFILSGYAGTGKTTLLKAMLESLHSSDNKVPRRAVLMAPTGRAAVILSEKTGVRAATIHKTIYQIDKGAQNHEGKMRFMLRRNEDSENTIYFVDESSMISDLPSDNDMFKFGTGCLLQDLFTYCQGKKIVFVGDSAQLPPVGQTLSPALDKTTLETKYGCKVASAFLREVVRQAEDSGVYVNATAIRKAIEANSFNEFGIVKGGDVHVSSNLFEDYIRVVDGKVDKNSAIITYSNALALEYNLKIRAALFPNTAERLVPGDLLIISRNSYAYNEELFNGTIIPVSQCAADSELEVRDVAFHTKERTSSGDAITKTKRLAFRSVTLDLGEKGLLKCKILDSFLTDDEPSPGLELTQALYADFTKRHPNIKRSSPEFGDAIKHDPYLNAVICKYGYAITCHKAQGGEWKNVFVDMDRNQGKRNSDFFHWAYTAVTRSSKNLWVTNAPRFDLFSEMQVGPVSKGGNVEFYIPNGENFMDYRYGNICRLCEERGLNCHEDRSKPFQHAINVTDNNGSSCFVQMWYGQAGYTGKDRVVKSSTPEFAEMVMSICTQSLVPPEGCFKFEDEKLSKVFHFVNKTAKESGLTIVNVVQLAYIVRFYMTNGSDYEVVSFNYNDKGQYTACTLQSSVGQMDEQLKSFRETIDK